MRFGILFGVLNFSLPMLYLSHAAPLLLCLATRKSFYRPADRADEPERATYQRHAEQMHEMMGLDLQEQVKVSVGGFDLGAEIHAFACFIALTMIKVLYLKIP